MYSWPFTILNEVMDATPVCERTFGAGSAEAVYCWATFHSQETEAKSKGSAHEICLRAGSRQGTVLTHDQLLPKILKCF